MLGRNLKKYKLVPSLVLVLSSNCLGQTTFSDGLLFGGNTYLSPFESSTSRTSLEFSSYSGGLVLYSDRTATNRTAFDGGVALYGNPISMVLGNGESPNGASFAVWKEGGYLDTTSGTPLFKIDSVSNTAVFNSVNVSLGNGSLSVSGDIFSGNQKIATEQFASSSANTAINNKLSSGIAVSGGNLLTTQGVALTGGTVNGNQATAMSGGWAGGANSVALTGGGAEGEYSTAMGWGNASGDYSIALAGGARGQYSVAIGQGSVAFEASTMAISGGLAWGFNSTAIGHESQSYSFRSIAVGAGGHTQGDPTNWIETDPIFAVGNASSTNTEAGEYPYPDSSNAMTVLKNGQTIVKNKYWNGASPTSVPVNAAQSSSGNALIVEGHSVMKGNALLEGKVTMQQPQGDISMGIYE